MQKYHYVIDLLILVIAFAIVATKTQEQQPTERLIVKPQAGGQWEYFTRTEFEVLFGGAAGPGKSWALVIDALGLQYRNTELGKAAIEVPAYRAVLFRRKTTQFTKLIDEGKKYYCPSPFHAEFIQHRIGDPGPSFNFPSGAKIFVCHMEREEHKEDHQGQEYQFIGFDELTQFSVTQYLYLFSRARSAIPGLNARIRATTNPTGSGLLWVKKRFIRNGSESYEPKRTYYFRPDPENPPEINPCGILTDRNDPHARSRTFVPGYLRENKVLLKADPTYAANIMAMGKRYEEALLRGNWDAFGGNFFDDFTLDLAVEPFPIPQEWTLYGSIDPGWKAPCSFGLTAKDFEGNMYRLFTYYERERSPSQHANAILRAIKEFPYTGGRMPELIVSGLDAFAKKDLYAIQSNELTFAKVFEDAGLYLQPAKTDRILGWWAFKEAMRLKKWRYFKGYNDAAIEEIVGISADEHNVEDIEGRGNDPNISDHFLDENRYLILAIYQPQREIKEETPKRDVWVDSVKPQRPDPRRFW